MWGLMTVDLANLQNIQAIQCIISAIIFVTSLSLSYHLEAPLLRYCANKLGFHKWLCSESFSPLA